MRYYLAKFVKVNMKDCLRTDASGEDLFDCLCL